jgi:acylphosphatase
VSEERAGFRVAGLVQGVGFRFWAQRVGSELGLRGAVRNLRDGGVEVHVLGASEAIASFERRLARGPAGARVERVERVASILPIPAAGFTIER